MTEPAEAVPEDERPFLYVARRFTKQPVREDGSVSPAVGAVPGAAPGYLRQGFKRKTHTVTTGVAKTGEESTKGTVEHTEDWEGRIAATAKPAPIRMMVEPDGRVRRMTMPEMIERGYFIVGRGPA